MLARTVVVCTLVVLAHVGLSRGRQPTPEIHTSNLPTGICPSVGNYLLPDITDSTSYYVCCGSQQTTVRKTCRYDALPAGQYDVFTPATYNSAAGECGSEPTNMTSGSFRSPETSAAPSLIQQLQYRFSPAVPNAEAVATCKSAATPPVSEVVTPRAAVPLRQAAVTGEWRLITNDKGRSSTGVVSINAVLLPESDKVLVWGRVHMDGSKDNYEPGVMGADGVPEVSAVFDTISGDYKVKKIRSTPFCTGNTIMPSGQVLATGGDDFVGFPGEKPGYTWALKGIRLYNPAKNTHGAANWDNGKWETLPDQLRKQRWYPTQALLPDGNRVVIVGGRLAQNNTADVRSAEIYDHKQRKIVSESSITFLKDLHDGYALFPVTLVLPYRPTNKNDVQIFMFSCNSAAVETLRPDNSWAASNAIGGWPSPGFCGARSMSGTATMLRLEPATGYLPEVVMFGGHSTANEQCRCDTPTSEWAHRIKLDKDTVDNKRFAWTREKMPHGRNLNDAVLLPSGKVLVVNGAKFGVVDNLRDAAFEAWLYDPKAAAGNRFTTLAPATVKRYYHSVALLLPDGSVMTSGNEYGECTAACARNTPLIFHHQAERFLPPYFFTGGRPEITSVSAKDVKYGDTVAVGYKGTVTGAVIITPAAVTHQVNMNQRNVKLVVVDNAKGKITVRMPPDSYITQPGYHMLFLMNGDTPCTRAAWVKLNL